MMVGSGKQHEICDIDNHYKLIFLKQYHSLSKNFYQIKFY